MTDFRALIGALSEGDVEFVLVGGAAAIAHGATRLTQDVDIVYRHSRENCARLAAALTPFDPYLRGVPRGLPFRLTPDTLNAGLNFTLTTSVGDLDLLGEIPGGGRYEELADESIVLSLFGQSCRCLSLVQLIRAKRAAGRPKDLEALAELEEILGEESGGA